MHTPTPGAGNEAPAGNHRFGRATHHRLHRVRGGIEPSCRCRCDFIVRAANCHDELLAVLKLYFEARKREEASLRMLSNRQKSFWRKRKRRRNSSARKTHGGRERRSPRCREKSSESQRASSCHEAVDRTRMLRQGGAQQETGRRDFLVGKSETPSGEAGRRRGCSGSVFR